jgi:23S rRNA U2552 (ribose-2'-O)-methylase RlmE/FtsJ
MWKEYFPNSMIYGIDIDPRCKASKSDRIKVFIGSQSDPAVIQEVCQEANGQFDVILDDGSHVNELTLKSFDLLFPHLKYGGLYIIEDTSCTYLGESLKKGIIDGAWPGMQYNQGVEFNNNREDMDALFKRVIFDLDSKTGEIEWLHFYSGFVIMKKIGISK